MIAYALTFAAGFVLACGLAILAVGILQTLEGRDTDKAIREDSVEAPYKVEPHGALEFEWPAKERSAS